MGDDFKTPGWLYSRLNKKYNFDFDPCPYKHDLDQWDGLLIPWGNMNFVNPPYSRKLKEAFIMKAVEESKKGKQSLLLIPVSTSSKIFHNVLKKYEITFVEGRIRFDGCKWVARQDHMLVLIKELQDETN